MQTPMRAIPVATAVLLVLALSGCHPDYVLGGSAPADPDGVPCSESEDAAAVWIDVNYSGNSVSTTSNTCTVDRGTQITWRGPVGNREGFQLQFDGEQPDLRAPRLPTSEYRDGRQKIQMSASNHSGEYTYDIITGNGGVDPVIIIRN